MPSKIKLIIFDLDGVLINSKNNMRCSWNSVIKRFNLKISFNKYFKYIGIPFEDILAIFGIKPEYHKEIKSTFSKTSLKNTNKIKLYPHVLKVISFLKKKKIKLSIVTSKDKYRSKKITQRFKIDIKQIFSPEKKLRGKPYPDQLIKSLKVNKIKANNAIYIGDTRYDFIAAKKAKIRFLHANYGYGKYFKIYKSKINNLKEIIDII